MTKEILVAGTDEKEQEEFLKIFELTDYRLIFSDKGEDVLLRTKLFKPDLIISKVDLGDQNGFDLCETLKTDPESKHIPFILVANLFENISEKDRKRVKADGVLSKPLREDEVLNLVDQLMEEEAMRMKEKEISEEKEDWKSFGEIRDTQPEKKDEILLGELEEEEEIIELVDVVEEPEPKASIHEFVPSGKTEEFTEVTPLERWGSIEEEKSFNKELDLFPKEEEKIELFDLELSKGPKEPKPEDEIFEKIELQELLDKVEKLKPSIEKEWPFEEEVERPGVTSTPKEEAEERYLRFEEFEKAPGSEPREASAREREFRLEEELPPILMEEPKAEAPSEEKVAGVEIEEERIEELTEEEFPEELLEEILGEEEVRPLGEAPKERLEEFKPEEIHREEAPLEGMALREITREKIRLEKPGGVEWSSLTGEQPHPPMMMVDKKMAEVIAQGVRDMMEDFIVKILPEITQNMLNLTMERIERMVKQVVPELAEKAIQEEIKRLQKEEKD